ncbi:MAG: catechol 2,3-dioxygenase-like lactoylglutathione lyase family enzyme [Alphaproteobacteria bacterium]|jgi:catechol 2,3-dioxygenase-like lactoylglutathione lyase family enzyme
MTQHLVEHFDHFVVPVDDIVAAEEFYMDVFKCKFALNSRGEPMRMGLNVHHRMANAVAHTFFIVAGRRVGVYLQDEPRAKPDTVYGAPTCSFESTPEGLDEITAILKARNAQYEGPDDDDSPIAARSLYFNDPAGNHFHLYVPRDGGSNAETLMDVNGPLTGMGYLQIEAPDLEKAVRFYTDIFALETASEGVNKRLGAPETTLKLPSGQCLILTGVPFSPKGMQLSRKIAGPHLAFYVPAERWEPLIERLAAANIGHADRAAEIKGRQAGDLDTYLDDPSGYVIQLKGALET